MSDLDPEDAKLITLARSARARTRAPQGAAVRDTDGRTYVAATVALPSLSLTALQLAVAMAVSSGALGLEAAVVVGDDAGDAGVAGDSGDAGDAGIAALHEVAPSATVLRADPDGALRAG